MPREANEEAIRKVTGEWMERMIRSFRTKGGCSTDNQIDCPACGGCRNVVNQYGGGSWQCMVIGCHFTFPAHLTPPSPEELERVWQRKQEERRVERTMRFVGMEL